MSMFRYILPQNTPPWIEKEGEVLIWRERILQTLHWLIFFGAILTFSLAARGLLVRKDYGVFAFYTIALLIMLVLPFKRDLPYGLRVRAVLFVFYALGVQNFFQYGVGRNGSIYMIAVMVLSGLLLGLKNGLLAMVIAAITMIGFATGMANGLIPAPDIMFLVNANQTSSWMTVGAHTIFLGAFIVSAITIIVNGLQTTLKKQVELNQEIEKARSGLEISVEQRTQDLVRRLAQLRTAASISRSITSMLEPIDLLQKVADLIKEEFDLYYVGIFLLDEQRKFAVLQAGTGEAGQKMMTNHHRLQVGGTSMIGWATSRLTPRIALDTGREAVRFNNPYLPLTRSEMALPIIARGTCLGALTIQSTKPNAFDENDIMILEGIADSIAIALENANLFQTTQQSLEEIRSLNRLFLDKGWQETLESSGKRSYSYLNPSATFESHGNQVQIPLNLRDQILGNIKLEIDQSSLSPEDMDFIEAVATQTAVALENARLVEETQRQAVQEQRLNEMSILLTKAVSVEDILKTAVRELGQIPRVTEVSVQLIPPDSESLIQNQKVEVNS